MKSEIREHLRNLKSQLSNLEAHSISEIKEIALEIYNDAVLLEFLENPKEDKTIPSEVEAPKIAKEISEVFYEAEETQHTENDEVIEFEEPAEESHLESEEKTPEEKPVYQSALNELEKFAAEFQNMPEFERKVPQTESVSESSFSFKEEKEQPSFVREEKSKQPLSQKLAAQKPKSLNDSINRGLAIGLNDRLAFVNQLFEGEMEDYVRVLSQINTLSSFEEARDFIETRVKPDYNNWQNKEEISNRFMMIIEKTFN